MAPALSTVMSRTAFQTAFHPSLPRHARARCLSTVKLAMDKYAAPSSAGEPLVVLHGLYGSKQNWRSLARAMAQRLNRDILTLDLRNHGASPSAREADYAHFAADVAETVKAEGLKEVSVLGHSMGGKVAMALALSSALPLTKLVVADISPAVGPISPDFAKYLQAMREINDATCATRKQADEILQRYKPDLGVRQFILTNLGRDSTDEQYKIRLPLEYLEGAIAEIGGFPYEPGKTSWDGPALFIKGKKSKYINRRNISVIEQFFPRYQLRELDTGHWVHAEKPKEFLEELAAFLDSK